ncbi:MAG: hypothetical protein QOE83_1163 [Actinomycetota bacterium]|jgi:hypothetical protein|nr:hypothetical protein [Actinomycetota bacterium]
MAWLLFNCAGLNSFRFADTTLLRFERVNELTWETDINTSWPGGDYNYPVADTRPTGTPGDIRFEVAAISGGLEIAAASCSAYVGRAIQPSPDNTPSGWQSPRQRWDSEFELMFSVSATTPLA